MIKPPAATLTLLKKRLGDFDSLSVRKRLCLAYLSFVHTKKFEWKLQLVEFAKEFRALPGRRGSHRTIVEKEARKFFREIKKHQALEACRIGAKEHGKKQRDREEGIHSPEELERNKLRWKEIYRKQRESGNIPSALDWVIVREDGVEVRIKNLAQWARDMGFPVNSIKSHAYKENKGRFYRGYTVRHYNEKTDSHIPWDERYKPKDI